MPIDAGIPSLALAGLPRAQPFDLAQTLDNAAIVQQRQAAVQKAQRDAQTDQQVQQLAQQYGDDYDGSAKAITRIDPERGQKLSQEIDKARTEGATAQLKQHELAETQFDDEIRTLQAATPDNAQEVIAGIAKRYPRFTPILAGKGYEDIPTLTNLALDAKDFNAKLKGSLEMFLDGKKQEAAANAYAAADTPAKRAAVDSMLKQGGLSAFSALYPDQATAQAAVDAQKTPEASAKVGSFEDYVTRKFGANPTPAQVLQARKEYGQADDRPRVSVSVAGAGSNDVKESVAGMKEGSIPPVLPGRASKEYVALLAEAHRQKFDLVKANEDWTATQKYLATLNGQQQTRLRQATEQVSESVPLVRSLVKQWDSAGIPMLSASNLAAAKAGTYGQKAQSLAVRLSAQIADMQSELGTVYKGGNSSTDESLKLAAENLQGQWSKQAALDALDQIETNIRYRKNSMRLPPVTGSDTNQYAPPGLNQGGTPQGVSSLLANKGPGIYTLSDGSKWRKDASGISKVQ